MNVYEPAEDTFLLATYVKQFAHGNVLDMGTGSGYLAEIAAKTTESVLAVDKDAAVLSYAKKTIKAKNITNITFLCSDLFEQLQPQQFDVIIFNPPYLPEDPENSVANHPALCGGKHGYETIQRFLKQAKFFLKPTGIILLLFSSLTTKEDVDRILQKQGYHVEELAQQRLFFEVLYVYKLSMHQLKKAKKKT
ncbi:methyltransferase [Candidatus Woesearchaeota archaeon]|nr:methyltransferase [Candidatus Woesearchaeota archaeon]